MPLQETGVSHVAPGCRLEGAYIGVSAFETLWSSPQYLTRTNVTEGLRDAG
jgi:hypothetical protein